MENLEIIDDESISNALEELLIPVKEQDKETILIVDDEENNLQLLKRTLRGNYNIITATNGMEAKDIIEQDGENIAMIISDQRMPKMQGTDFLKSISQEHPDIVKILLTGYSDIDVIIESINACNLYQYILKPFNPDDLKHTINNGIEKHKLTSNNTAMLKDLKELFYKTIKSIASALDAKDTYTHGHSHRVTLYSLMLAKELNLDEKMLEEIETAGLLHDIGKIGIPESILCKPGKLTDEEFAIMKSHPEQGEKMIMDIKKLNIISDWLKTHHERWDGTGYPMGLKGEEIPLTARIIALADTYDAMTSTRSYRQALSHEEAMSEIKRCTGTQFDPNLAELFVSISEEIKAAHDAPDEYYDKYTFLHKHIQ